MGQQCTAVVQLDISQKHLTNKIIPLVAHIAIFLSSLQAILPYTTQQIKQQYTLKYGWGAAK